MPLVEQWLSLVSFALRFTNPHTRVECEVDTRQSIRAAVCPVFMFKSRNMTRRTSLLFAFLISISGALSIDKRGDDVDIQSLMTLVQQQAATIQQQAATMEVMKTQLTSLQTSVQQLSSFLSNINTNLSEIHSRLDTRVFFTAHMTQVPITIGTSNSPLAFSAVVTNEGGAYDPFTGVFTAPQSGVYVFYAQLMNHIKSAWLQWAISKAGTTLLCVDHLEPGNYYDKSSCQATARIQKGETVMVRRVTGGGPSIIEGGTYCSFTGFLLSVDA